MEMEEVYEIVLEALYFNQKTLIKKLRFGCLRRQIMTLEGVNILTTVHLHWHPNFAEGWPNTNTKLIFFYTNTNTMLYTSMGNPISQSLLTKPKMFWLTEKVFCISDIMWIALVDEFFCKQDLLCTMLFFWHIFLALFSKVSAADGKSLRRALQKARKELWKC